MSKKRLKKNSERLAAAVAWVILPEVHGTSACNAQFNMVLHLISHRSQTFLSGHQISVFFLYIIFQQLVGHMKNIGFQNEQEKT